MAFYDASWQERMCVKETKYDKGSHWEHWSYMVYVLTTALLEIP